MQSLAPKYAAGEGRACLEATALFQLRALKDQCPSEDGGWGWGKTPCWPGLWALDGHLQIWGKHRWMPWIRWVLTGLCSQTGLELNLSLMELDCENTTYPHSVSMAWAQDENVVLG